MFKEFKEFISKGNVIDLAVGVIIGGAFGKIVTSFVDDMIMPVLGILLGKVNFSTLRVIITPATESKAESAILYGNFIQNVVNFLIMAFILFIMIKFINKLRKPKTEEVVATVVEPTKEEKLLAEIRDILKNK
ncbi:MAG: large-conductance mechanosensitive channel protein MscL [Leptotrichiaceae bacterium]|nr:large-conductance mechanosensitive channel protein MscL [Leptotrichiaceae bacterium]MBP6281914.1 large-conductance mechanosensitive channel protein MscL [Leptotrichiaceae bacterium]MBP7100462.1 large-conductance mechanosensitive channel protein MscL [Leptotrichiaceae bacterium]MBP9630581.1 large-conductance mechanosensitive channel protein MscL [Leptotrichiaceae bacterium]